MPSSLKEPTRRRTFREETAATPLCVDLDGTLIRTDLLFESVLLLLRENFLYIFCLPFWLLAGKAAFKRRLSSKVTINPSELPYNEPLLTWIHKQRKLGRRTVLATGSNRRVAEQIADHLDCFDEVIASDDNVNLTSKLKSATLVRKFGQNAFDYAGNSQQDVLVWRDCHHAIVVHASGKTLSSARSTGSVSEIFPGPQVGVGTWFRAARVHQWIKNLLVALPLLTSHRVSDITAVKSVAILFFAFSTCASATYIVNDLLDLRADRKHSIKASRPFASGELAVKQGLWMALGLAAVSVTLASLLPYPARLVLGFYFALTFSYSMWLKQTLILDVLVLAGLYTIRIIAGGVATHIKLSEWLISFSLFLFLSLAICKRSSELMNLLKANKTRPTGRSYETGDLEPLNICGACCGMLACLLILFYANSQQAHLLYATPQLLYFLCPVLFYWISRLWILTFRGELKEDPILFAVHDRVSYAVCIVMVLIAGLAAFVKLPLDRFLQ